MTPEEVDEIYEHEVRHLRQRAEAAEAELAASRAREQRLRDATRSFVEWHDNGQAGQPGFPRTYGETDVWQAEWDRRYVSIRAILAEQREVSGE